MTREESVVLADKLEKEYSKLEKLQKKLHQNTTEINRPYTPRKKMKKGERFGFNWYPIIGILVCIPIHVLAILFYFSYFALRWDHKPGADLYFGLSIAMVFLSIVVFLVLQVIGSKRNNAEIVRFNEGVDREIQNREEKMISLEKRNHEIDTEIAELSEKLSAYNETIPPHYRASKHMFQAKKLIQTHRTEDFEDALALLQKKDITAI